MSSVIRRSMAAIGTVALLAVGVHLLGTTSASAHDNHVSGVAACQADGTYTVTWTIVNDWNQGVDTVTVNGFTPSGSALAPDTLSLNPVSTPGSTGTMTQTGIPGAATAAGIDIKGHWDYDGFTQPSRLGSVALPGQCLPTRTPTAPTWTNGACVNGAVSQPTITIPSQPGVTYTDNGTVESPGTYQAGAGVHKIVAKSTSATLGGQRVWTFTLTQASGDCSKHATPTTPNVTAISCVNHHPTRPGLVLPTTTGIRYVAQTAAPYHAGQQVEVVAIAKKGYRLGNLPAGWTRETSTRAVTTVRMPAAHQCGSEVAPAHPKVTQAYCPVGRTAPAAPTLTLPANTTEVHYRVVEIGKRFAQGPGTTRSYQPGQTVRVSAIATKGHYFVTAPAGWKLVNDRTATRTITFTKGPNTCTLSATTTTPGFTPEQCVSGVAKGGSYTIPSTKGVVYQVNGTTTPAGTYPAPPSSKITVVATPAKHYKLVGQSVWSHTFGATPQCSKPTPPTTPTTPTPSKPVPPTAPHGIDSAHTGRTVTPPAALASTGVPTSSLIGGGIALLLVGGLITVMATRRRSEEPTD